MAASLAVLHTDRFASATAAATAAMLSSVVEGLTDANWTGTIVADGIYSNAHVNA